LYEHKPKIEDIKKGSESRIYFYCRNVAGDPVDFTGGSVSVTFTPRTNGSPWSKAGVLSASPSAEPQCYVILAEAETQFIDPQLVDVSATVIVSGVTYKPGGFFRLLAP